MTMTTFLIFQMNLCTSFFITLMLFYMGIYGMKIFEHFSVKLLHDVFNMCF